MSKWRGVRSLFFGVLFLLITTIGFQNCSSGIDASNVSTVSSSSTSALSLNEEGYVIYQGASLSLNASGGSSPYSYSLYSGVGSVTGATYTASDVGTAWIRVTDSAGTMGYFALTVNSYSGSTTTTTTVTSSSGSPIPIYRFYSTYYGRHFFTSNYAEGVSMGYTYEGIPFYVVSAAGTSASRALYRCYISSSNLHYPSASSEICGSTSYESTYGYIYTDQVSGSVPLYGYYHTTTGDFLVTTNSAEGANAGYTYWGTYGYVYMTN